MSIRKDVARVVRLKEFHSRVEQLLTPGDRDYLFYALKEYNTYKSVAKLMLALNSCLDTPKKLDLLPSIRDLIPRHDRKKFDSLAPYSRMAHPLVPVAAAASSPSEGDKNRAEGGVEAGLGGEGGKGGSDAQKLSAPGLGAARTVFLQRSREESLGFSIRGGREHGLGIFISQIDSFSLADKSGLLVGDQITCVNGVDFGNITHQSAVLILKSHDQLQVSVVSVGHVPGHPRDRKSLIWVDTSGNPVDDGHTAAELSASREEDRTGGDRLLASPDRHKVVLHVEKQQPLGVSVRGGKEYSLGIFISQVDCDSPAEQFGLKAGDQILDVNGHNFLSILHQEAVTILRTYTTLIMTIRSLGRLPVLVSEGEDETDGVASPEPRTPQPPPPSPPPSPPPHPPPHEPPPAPQSSSPLPQQTHRPQETGHTHSTGHAHRHADHAHPDTAQSKRWSNWKKSVTQRSQSVREFLRPRSMHSPNLHHHHRHQLHPPRSHSHRHPARHSHQDLAPRTRLRTGSDGALVHGRKTHRAPLTSSPLAVSQGNKDSSPRTLSGASPTTPAVPHSDQTGPQQATPSPAPPKEAGKGAREREGTKGSGERGDTKWAGERGGKKFFRYGVGTQLMLAASSSSAQALLEDSARRCLNAEEMAALTDRLKEYESNGGVEAFAEFLVSLLDTPRKMQLLSDIRSVLIPTDLVAFDGLVSPHEIAALQKRASVRESQDTGHSTREVDTSTREVVTSAREVVTSTREVVTSAREVDTSARETDTWAREVDTSARETDTSGRIGQAASISARSRGTELSYSTPPAERRASHKVKPSRRPVRDTQHSAREVDTSKRVGQTANLLGAEVGLSTQNAGSTPAVKRRSLEVDAPGGLVKEAGHLVRGATSLGREANNSSRGGREQKLPASGGRQDVQSGAVRVGHGEGGSGGNWEKEEEEEEEEEEGGERDVSRLQQVGLEETSAASWQDEVIEEEEKGEEERREPAAAKDTYNLVLYEIQNHQGQESLRRAVVKDSQLETPHIGAFSMEPANSVLSRAVDEEPSMLGMQTRESFLEWNEDYSSESWERGRGYAPSKNPVVIEIAKRAPQLGLTITGGVDTSSPEVIITDVKEGGAAGIDGFLQPGFEIVEVDGVRVRGMTHNSAARQMAAAFRSERPTIELVVVPT